MFKVGQRVVIRKDSHYYGHSASNPDESVVGEIDAVHGGAKEDDDGDLRIDVQWDNGEHNSYDFKDLRLARTLPNLRGKVNG